MSTMIVIAFLVLMLREAVGESVINAMMHIDMRYSNVSMPITLSADMIEQWKKGNLQNSPFSNLIFQTENRVRSTTARNRDESVSWRNNQVESVTSNPIRPDCPLSCDDCMRGDQAIDSGSEMYPSGRPRQTDYSAMRRLTKRKLGDCFDLLFDVYQGQELVMKWTCLNFNLTVMKVTITRTKRSLFNSDNTKVGKEAMINTCVLPVKPSSLSKPCYNIAGISFDEVNRRFCTYSKGCEVGSVLKEDQCVIEDEGVSPEPVCSESAFKIDLSNIAPNPTVPRFVPGTVCKIGEMVLREDCEETRMVEQDITLVNFNGQEHLVLVKHHFIFQEQLDNINNYVCTNCVKPICKQCKGDGSYVLGFGNHSNSQCYCKIVRDAKFGAIHMIMSGQQFRVKYFFKFNRMVTYKKLKPNSVPLCEDCKLSCSGTVLSIEDLNSEVKYVKICSSTICETVSAEKAIQLPLVFHFLSLNLEVYFLSESNKHSSLFTVTCDKKTGCELLECSFCLERLVNVGCYTTKEYFYIVIVLILISLVLGIILKFLSILLKLCNIIKIFAKATYGFCVLVLKLSGKLCGISLRRGRTIYRQLETSTEDETVEFVEEQPSIRIAVASPWRNKIYRKNLLFIILIMVVGQVQPCTKVNTVTIKDQDCLMVDNKVQCEMATKMILNLGTLETDSCLNVMNGERIAGTIHFKISSVKTKCIEEHLYWTYDPVLHSQQSCRCWSLGVCSEDRCQRDTLTNMTAFEEGISRKTGPGIEGCLGTNSQFLSRCGTPLNGCCFYSVTLKPKERKAYRVSRCSGWYWEVDVSIKSMFTNANEIGTLKLIPGIEVSQPFGNIMLTSVSQPVLDDQQKCFVVEDLQDESYFVNCNKKGEQIIGRVGEVKCSSRETVLSSPHECTFPTKSMSIIPQNSGLNPQVQFSNLETLLKGNKLPVINSLFKITQEDGTFLIQRSTSESFQVSITLSKFDVKPVYQLPECKMKFIDLTGCYQCLQGARIKFTTQCKTYPALGSISCPSIDSSITPFVAEKEGIMHLKTIFKKEAIDEKCSVSIGRTSTEIDIKGSLIRVIFNESTYDSNNILLFKKTMGTDYLLVISEMWKSATNWFSGLGMGKIIFILGILAGLILIFTIKILLQSNTSKLIKMV